MSPRGRKPWEFAAGQRALVIVLLSMAAAAAPAWAQSGSTGAAPGPRGPLVELQEFYDAKRYVAVIDKLAEGRIERLPRRDQPQAYFLWGLSHQYRGETDKALGVFQVAASIYPKDINILSHLAQFLHGADLDDRARPIYERVLAIHPNNAAAHLGMGEIDHARGLLERSAEHFEKCLQDWGDNARAWKSYAAVLTDLRQYPKALSALEKSRSLDPSDLDTLRVLADLQRREGLGGAAYATLDRFAEAAATRPESSSQVAEAVLQRALWLLEDGDLPRSLVSAQKALADAPGDPLALWIRAQISLRGGLGAEAAKDLAEAAAQERQAPFVAAASRVMLKESAQP